LESGNVLTLFTDGVTETTGDTGEEFGEDRLLGAVHASRNLESASILRNVEQAVKEFRSSAQPEDDVTLVVARVQ
jgi:sigma-B regulation protein RsbU (phosphoserine phosphatase)